MKGWLVACFVMPTLLVACSESRQAQTQQQQAQWALKDTRSTVEDLKHQLHGTQTSLELVEERLATQDKVIAELRQQISDLKRQQTAYEVSIAATEQKVGAVEQNIARIDTLSTRMTADLRKLQTANSEAALSTAACNTRVQQVEASVGAQVAQIKTTLESMRRLLADGSARGGAPPANASNARSLTTAVVAGNVYTVKPGDTLGRIAKQNQTTIEKLRELNNLPNDRIYSGQQLSLP